MMTTDIVNEIARLMSTREVGSIKAKKEIRADKGLSGPHDEVELSEKAQTFASQTAPASEYEKEQYMKVERLKALVNGGNYHMDDQVITSIAERIANTLL